MLPELVSSGSNGQKSVNYANMSAVIVEAIKEQQQMIKKLQDDINELKNNFRINIYRKIYKKI